MRKKGIKKIEDLARLGKADLHIHSHYSDGRPNVSEILEYVEHYTDLDVIAISDHDTMEGAFEAKKLTQEKKYRFELVLAEEITSIEGHLLGVFLKSPIPPGLPAAEVIEKVKSQGGLIIAVHPFEKTRWHNENMITMDGIGLISLLKLGRKLDGIEVVNATPTLADENLSASLLNKGYLMQAEIGSSDAHILDAIGKGYTLFEGKTALDLKKAIITHQTRAMYTHWTLLALIKYFFFFIPMGFRMFANTILHGRKSSSTSSPRS
jgi:predicted metal-dependent phosphoesterase TrpH